MKTLQAYSRWRQGNQHISGNAAQEEHEQDNFVDNRPSMKLLESSFEQGTESSESEQKNESNEPTAVRQNRQIIGVPAHTLAPIPPPESPMK